MDILENYSLQSHNTLALQQTARFFVRVNNEKELLQACQFAKEKNLSLLMLGDGSNLVLSRDYGGLVVQNLIKGMEVIAEDMHTITLDVGAGENWHALVCHTLKNNWFGLENLALIPGTVGAAPVQNIGAYGVELCSLVTSIRALDTVTNEWRIFNNKQCQFHYRDSVFKHELGRMLITRVQLRLQKTPVINIQYQALKNWFETSERVDLQKISPQQVCDAVMDIRRSRLPDPLLIPNAGSFFKNPIVPVAHYQQLIKQFSALVSYPAGDSQRKLAAAWLIDQAGWKGVSEGPVAVHDKQALVLINRGGATGAELLAFAAKIIADIKKRYGIVLEIEPTVI
jgi:UDP-N-acetylmuramate dehydrogenase